MNHIKADTKHAIEHQDELIKMFAAEPEKKLIRRLNIISLQSVDSEKQKDEIVSEFLEIMRRIIIEARLYKWDNNIPDAPDEMEEYLAETDAAEKKLEHRKKVLEEHSKPEEKEAEEIKEEPKTDNNVQLGLF